MDWSHTALTIGVILGGALTLAGLLIWVERRLLGVWQERLGPNRLGPGGCLQSLADMIKIFTKEDWIPPFADKPVFVIAPAIVVITALMSFAVIPIAPSFVVSDLNLGVMFFLAMSSLAAYSVIIGGWASNSKFAFLGSLRAIAQLLSYEVINGLWSLNSLGFSVSLWLDWPKRIAHRSICLRQKQSSSPATNRSTAG
jgi:NADH-quinone oxidoreductase subunit H